MKTNQENCEGVDQAPCCLGGHVLAENRAVGQRELKVFGDQYGCEFFAKGIASPGDDRSGKDRRSPKAREVTKELIFAVCDAISVGQSSRGISQGKSNSAGSTVAAVISSVEGMGISLFSHSLSKVARGPQPCVVAGPVV